jgi:type I restriction enzyme S subunit
MSDNISKLPPTWTEKRIEELFAPLADGRTLHQGWSPQCDKVPSPSEDDWGVLKTTSIQAGEFQPVHNKLLPSGLEPRPMIEVKEGDILLTCAGPRVRCGVSCLVRQTRKRLMMSGKMYRFRVDVNRTDARYVEAFLQTERARQAIDKMKTGSSDSGLNLTHERFRQLSVPVAPLTEQRRIVAEIEKQFTRLEAGVAALRRVQANLKRYRAAVLKAACEGRLVPTEAELCKVAAASRRSPAGKQSRDGSATFETGEALLARILTERRQNWQGRGKYKEPTVPDTAGLPQLPQDWTWATVEQISTRVQYGSSAKTNEDSTGVPVLRMGNIQKGKFDFDKLKYLPKAHDEFPELLLTKGDLLFNRTNSAEPLGKTAVFKDTPQPCSFASYLIRVRFGGGCLPDFVSYFINSVFGRAWISDVVSQQVGQANVNGTKLQALAIPLPPLAEQTRIVAEVERRLSVVEELEAVVSTNLQRAVSLRQSILQKAFTGELTGGATCKNGLQVQTKGR